MSLLWVAVGVVGLISVAPGIDRAVTSGDRTAAAVADDAIARARDGQFYVDGKAGAATIRFLVDPDADEVLIAGADAQRLGLTADATGNVTLDNLAVGGASQTNVTAQLAPAMPVSVLGRTYLDRLAIADVQGDRLVLR